MSVLSDYSYVIQDVHRDGSKKIRDIDGMFADAREELERVLYPERTPGATDGARRYDVIQRKVFATIPDANSNGDPYVALVIDAARALPLTENDDSVHVTTMDDLESESQKQLAAEWQRLANQDFQLKDPGAEWRKYEKLASRNKEIAYLQNEDPTVHEVAQKLQGRFDADKLTTKYDDEFVWNDGDATDLLNEAVKREQGVEISSYMLEDMVMDGGLQYKIFVDTPPRFTTTAIRLVKEAEAAKLAGEDVPDIRTDFEAAYAVNEDSIYDDYLYDGVNEGTKETGLWTMAQLGMQVTSSKEEFEQILNDEADAGYSQEVDDFKRQRMLHEHGLSDKDMSMTFTGAEIMATVLDDWRAAEWPDDDGKPGMETFKEYLGSENQKFAELRPNQTYWADANLTVILPTGDHANNEPVRGLPDQKRVIDGAEQLMYRVEQWRKADIDVSFQTFASKDVENTHAFDQTSNSSFRGRRRERGMER